MDSLLLGQGLVAGRLYNFIFHQIESVLKIGLIYNHAQSSIIQIFVIDIVGENFHPLPVHVQELLGFLNFKEKKSVLAR